ncbi:HAD-IIB family hydrolase [Guyparkeria halopsychrophila]|uniref:HAD-IIB family hydrolase n=1 Tax=Guyparkeria halopsychrophila TaxID=3139421 RepID=UPI0037C9A44E
MSELLICTDLDRTLIPNGHQLESRDARDLFWRLARRPEVTLAYVSGRDRRLLQSAIDEFSLPVPDFAIGDVGTTIYRIDDGEWHAWEAWAKEIAADWGGNSREMLAEMLVDIPDIEPQESEKQNTYKLSYYAPADLDGESLAERIGERLAEAGVRSSVIWSIDEMRDVGLVDVLPAGATKVHAIRFLQAHLHASPSRTVFAGDSGNDLPVLTSGLQAIVVANARDEIKQAAIHATAERGAGDCLYVARGGFLGMNGNYAAGILEGVVHFIPEARSWLEIE